MVYGLQCINEGSQMGFRQVTDNALSSLFYVASQ